MTDARNVKGSACARASLIFIIRVRERRADVVIGPYTGNMGGKL